MESGLENAERSTSSDHGRRVERPDRTFSVMLLMKARKAGVATGAWDSTVWGFEIGRIAGDDDAIRSDYWYCG
ncbi:hypothetical protein Hanom_Chr01g00037691 [Helianthus anomalus]